MKVLKNAIIKDFWKAAFMTKDLFKIIENMSDSGEEDEYTEEESDDNGDKDKENIGNGDATVYMKKMEKEAQPSSHSIKVSEYVDNGGDRINIVEDASMDKMKNDDRSSDDHIIAYEKLLKKFISC
ncbi:hypothetical protein TorRG33x02_206230 [Trema orientale]|uniref:Uncharacterized protein n=1 Tax=Trema orientale TaxID=63057 RepID=A0A2P5EDF0_TREOI|nr:hypothetical protein TorRG33x02_206230 [Trema orientale]